MTAKYELLEQDKGTGLRRIRALRDIPRYNIKAGDLGGGIESEKNLSQEGDAWVDGNARVRDNALVYDNARVYDNALVCGNTWFFGIAQAFGNAQVYGDTRICGNTWVSGNAQVYGNTRVCGNAWVSGNARVRGNAWVGGNGRIISSQDYFCVGPMGSRDDFTTFFKGSDGDIYVRCGCFFDSLKEFADRVKNIHGNDQHGNDYLLLIELAKSRIGINEGAGE